MTNEIHVGDHVQIRPDRRTGRNDDWFGGTVVRIDPYSQHRSFHWVELDPDGEALLGIKMISVLNPKNIRKIQN